MADVETDLKDLGLDDASLTPEQRQARNGLIAVGIKAAEEAKASKIPQNRRDHGAELRAAAGKGRQKPKGRPGRPKGRRDAPDTPRQVDARERQIREENAARDRELLARAEKDPSLREWVNLPPEAGEPVYDLLHASIVGFTGLPGLSQDKTVRSQWATAFVGVCNYYKLDLLSHPLVQLGVVSFVAATPSIAAWRTLKRIEALLKAGRPKDDAEVKALVEEAKRLGVTFDAKAPEAKAA